MASPADIVASMMSLEIGPSLDPSNPKTELTKVKTNTMNSQHKPKPQPAKTNPINVPKGLLGSQLSKSQPLKSQPEFPTTYPVYTLLGPPPRLSIKQMRGRRISFKRELSLVLFLHRLRRLGEVHDTVPRHRTRLPLQLKQYPARLPCRVSRYRVQYRTNAKQDYRSRN